MQGIGTIKYMVHGVGYSVHGVGYSVHGVGYSVHDAGYRLQATTSYNSEILKS